MSSTLRKCLLACIAAALGATTVLLPALAGAEAPPIEPVEQGSPYPTFYWSRSSEEVPIGGQVVFKNPSTSVFHGLEFEGAAKPSCSGAPAGAGATSWQASCTFSAPGKYTFYCTVHPSTMRGTITVAPGGTTTTTTTTTSPGGTTGGGTGTSPYPPPGAGAPAGSVPLFVGGTNAVK
ncbi:MAG TPA: plastocyanin/azurin family copper-binding protein, partial [Solirubrobacteraceae bacterium]